MGYIIIFSGMKIVGCLDISIIKLLLSTSLVLLKNRKQIQKLIKEIQPELVHVIGAENPQYSLALLDIPDSIPTIIQLQALLNRIAGVTAVAIEKRDFSYKGNLEREIFLKADFIATTVADFRDYIKKEIKPDAKFLDISLAMSNEINLIEEQKIYDFVYFSANIVKAGDEALKSFVIAQQLHPEITLNIVGGYDEDFKKKYWML